MVVFFVFFDMLRRLIHLLGFLSAFVLPGLFLISLQLGSVWVGLVPAFALLIIPMLDQLSSLNHRNLKSAETLPLPLYQAVLVLWVFIQVGLLVYSVLYLNQHPPQSFLEGLMLVVSMGIITGGIGITVAHELVHKKEAWAKQAGAILLTTVAYTHFIIQHIEGHHVWVGTDKDPVTAKKGQSIYGFLMQAIPHGFIQAWTIEKARLQKKQLSLWSFQNRIMRYILGFLLCFSLFFILAFLQDGYIHWYLIVFLFGQAILAFSLLEMVDYLEHYGLTRSTKGNRLEPVGFQHSWNSGHRISNFLLFQLQRHPDHHGDWLKWYPYLESKRESPQLPSGYPAMILLAAVPPLWFRMIDPILEEYEMRS